MSEVSVIQAIQGLRPPGRQGHPIMTSFPTLAAWSGATVRLVCGSVLLLGPNATAGDPDSLPLPRTKALQALSLPTTTPPQEASADDDPAPAKTEAELPRPEGRPGRAPEPPGSGKDTDTKGKEDKKEKKKEPPPPDGRCDLCGGCECVLKVCLPKLTEKEIKKVCWDAKCEDFCVPGPSIWCGQKCQKDDCGCWSHEVWKPTCAEVRTRVVPVRKETKRKVPAVEWKVVERCACCRAKAPCAHATAQDPAESPASAKPDGAAPAAKKTAALPTDQPGFGWPWSRWLR
jgi:hypothetical protein